jgi:uncharacterized protein (TIGR03435 family)
MAVPSGAAFAQTPPPRPEFEVAALRALDGSSGDSLFAALQGVGLKLETRKAPLEVLVFDQVLKTPTGN